MRYAALAAALLCASQGAAAQTEPPRQPAAARAVDDARSRQLFGETQAALSRGEYAAAEKAGLALLGGGYSRDGHHFSRAHPFFWAAFVYVGD